MRRRIGLLAVSLMLVAACGTASPHFVAAEPPLPARAGALSVAWADADGDGDLDLAVGYQSGDVTLYNNDGGRLATAPGTAGLGLAAGEARALAWGDYDGDGDLDLFVGARRGESALYRNDGDGGFTDVAEELELALPDVNARQAAWVDFDNDGYVDLFVANRSGPNRLFRGDGRSFADVSVATGMDDERPAVGACWFDFDGDGWLDVFITSQGGSDDALYRNDRGTFHDVAAEAGVIQAGRGEEDGGVGCSVGDFDNDGRFDVFVATYGEDLLYRNEGDGTFSEVAAGSGISGSSHMVAATWGDYDNDGLLDLFVAGYRRSNEGVRVPDDRLFRNLGERFVNVLESDSLLNDADHGVQWADFDEDGDLDLALADGYDAAGGQLLFANELAEPAAGRSLRIAIVDAEGRHTRAGAEVRLYDASGTLLGSRLVPTGDGYNAHSARPVHFGLAEHGTVSVEVTFMTGAGRATRRIDGIDSLRRSGSLLIVRQAELSTSGT